MSTREKLFVLWIALLPFIMWRGIFEGAKVVWFLGGGFFLAAFWILKLRDKIPEAIYTSDIFFFGWLFVLLVASILGVHPEDSILGGSYRHQGVLFFFALWLVAKSISILPRAAKKFLVSGLTASVLIESVIIILQEIFGITYFGRPLGTFGEPNAAAGFLAVASIFAFGKLKKKKLVFILTLVLLAIFSTQSRAAILAFVFVLFGGVIAIKKNLHIQSFIFLAGTAAVTSLIFLVAATARPQSQYESRSLFWRVGWGLVLEKPILGYGAETGEVLYEKAFIEAKNPMDLIVDRSHNLLLDVTIWSGFSGLILFLAWLTSEFLKLTTKMRLAFLGWLVFSMFQPLGVTQWILLAVIFSS